MKSLAVAACLLACACQKGDEKKPAAAADPAPRTEPAAPGDVAPGDRPAAIGADELAMVDAMAGFITGLRDAIESNKGDCDRMAAALGPIMERGRPVLDRARALEKKLASDKAARDWIQAEVEKKTGSLAGIVKSLEGCASDPGVRSSLDGFIE